MSAFDVFKSSFKGDLVLPSDAEYEKAIARWANNANRRAKIVVFVKDAEDVSLAINFARSEKFPLAIRGGGHNVSGASSSQDGLVIDLSKYVNGVRVDPEEKLAYVGGGAIWETVDNAAIKHGLATVGGTVNHTGVAGLTLGGGYGWLSAEHGLAIDNLVQVTMVVGDGTIVTANEDKNSDLFWAVRGSGCNFGVCVEFVFQLHDQRETVYSGALIYPAPLIDAVFKTTRDWWEKGPSSKEGMFMFVTRGPPPERHPCVICSPFFNGSDKEGREVFKAFLDLKPLDLTSEIPYEKLNALQNSNVIHGQNVYMRGVAQSTARPESATAVFKKIASDDSSFRLTAIFEYVPLNKVVTVPNNAMAFNNRSTVQNVLINCTWDKLTPENEKIAKEKVYEISDIISSFEKDSVESAVRAYGNYAAGTDMVSSTRAAKLFGDNYPKLQVLKKKYDPDFIFTKWFPIAPV